MISPLLEVFITPFLFSGQNWISNSLRNDWPIYGFEWNQTMLIALISIVLFQQFPRN